MMEPNPRVLRPDPRIEDAIRNNRCYMGGEQVYYEGVPDYVARKAKGPGHIYSGAGLREYKMSGACEFHFDLAFAKLEDEVFADDYNLRSGEADPIPPEEEEMAPQDEKIL